MIYSGADDPDPLPIASLRLKKTYELSNHLGNVLSVVSDRKSGIDAGSDGSVDYYLADILRSADYYPFGLEMPERTTTSEMYRYGFNSKEKDDALGSITHYDYGFRIYNPGIGRFLSVDPLTGGYPWYTPYQFAGNMPVWAIDLDGLEPVIDGGILVGYIVMRGQGPTQIAQDISDPLTMQKYGYNLKNNVTWVDIINHKNNNSRFFSHIQINRYDKYNNTYKSLNMNPGQFIDLTFLSGDPFNNPSIGHFTGNGSAIYQEAVRLFNRALINPNRIKGTDLINIRNVQNKRSDKQTTLLSDDFKWIGGNIAQATFSLKEADIEFQLTLIPSNTEYVSNVIPTIYKSHLREREGRLPELFETKHNPFAFDVITKVNSRNTMKEPDLLIISFKTQNDRQRFLDEIRYK